MSPFYIGWKRKVSTVVSCPSRFRLLSRVVSTCGWDDLMRSLLRIGTVRLKNIKKTYTWNVISVNRHYRIIYITLHYLFVLEKFIKVFSLCYNLIIVDWWDTMYLRILSGVTRDGGYIRVWEHTIERELIRDLNYWTKIT